MPKKVCVVGGGRWGKNHIRTLHQLGALAGICETDEASREALAAQYPGVKTFALIEDALAEDFDGFTVATPAETHVPIAEFLLRAKKHVLVEKPLALTSKEARSLGQLARQQGVNLMVGHVLLFHPAIRRIKDLIAEGKVGKLQYLYSNRLNLGTVRKEENILWSFAPHDISLFQYLIGTSPTEVVSRGGAFVQPLIHDSTMTILSYPDNVVGHIFVSWLHPFKEQRLVVIGSKGMLSFEDSSEDKQLLFYEKGIDWVQGEPIKREGPTEIIPYDAKMPLTEELRYFLDRLDGSPVEIASADNGVEVLEILERATDGLLSAHPEAATLAPAPTSPKPYSVHESAYVDNDVLIGDGTKIWHFSHIQSHVRIGKKVSIGQNVVVGEHVKIGNGCKIQNNVSVYEGVELEDFVFCGPSMVFTNVHDPRSKYPQRGAEFYLKTLLKEGASVGANATIVCGNTLGRHCFIGAGSVVTKDVPDYALMVGNPARRIGWMCECGERLREETQKKTCPRCQRAYEERAGLLHPGAS